MFQQIEDSDYEDRMYADALEFTVIGESECKM